MITKILRNKSAYFMHNKKHIYFVTVDTIISEFIYQDMIRKIWRNKSAYSELLWTIAAKFIKLFP